MTQAGGLARGGVVRIAYIIIIVRRVYCCRVPCAGSVVRRWATCADFWISRGPGRQYKRPKTAWGQYIIYSHIYYYYNMSLERIYTYTPPSRRKGFRRRRRCCSSTHVPSYYILCNEYFYNFFLLYRYCYCRASFCAETWRGCLRSNLRCTPQIGHDVSRLISADPSRVEKY